MASSDYSDSDMAPSNRLVLQFSALCEPSAEQLKEGEVSYEGDDTYRFEGNVRGEPLAMTFLSRAATAEFLEWLLTDGHKVTVASKNGGFLFDQFNDKRYDSLMRYLLVLRDSRPSRIF